MTFANLRMNPDLAIETFVRQSVDDQLALLWCIYTKVGGSVTPAAPDAASPEIVEGLFNQVKQLSHDQQLDEMRNLAIKRSSTISREYGALSANSKLAFWYRLAKGMDNGTIVPMPSEYHLSDEARELLAAVETMDFEQQITFLRSSVNPMGAEPRSGAAI
ncbi:MAG TPA: orange carotenoid protein N-terminal domain-containing protein [Elainellaceae cyanobacterium]